MFHVPKYLPIIVATPSFVRYLNSYVISFFSVESVTPGWLGVSGKSGMYYVFSNYGDEAEIEYGDLFALKNIINIDGRIFFDIISVWIELVLI